MLPLAPVAFPLTCPAVRPRGLGGAFVAPDQATALARLENERFGGDRCTVVTMNVDGLHTAAGSSDVVEVHGTVNRVLCK